VASPAAVARPVVAPFLNWLGELAGSTSFGAEEGAFVAG
jgi:hypothetical protein